MSEARAVDEIEGGERFGFGENWKEFLRGLDEKTIIGAEDALKKLSGGAATRCTGHVLRF